LNDLLTPLFKKNPILAGEFEAGRLFWRRQTTKKPRLAWTRCWPSIRAAEAHCQQGNRRRSSVSMWTKPDQMAERALKRQSPADRGTATQSGRAADRSARRRCLEGAGAGPAVTRARRRRLAGSPRAISSGQARSSRRLLPRSRSRTPGAACSTPSWAEKLAERKHYPEAEKFFSRPQLRGHLTAARNQLGLLYKCASARRRTPDGPGRGNAGDPFTSASSIRMRVLDHLETSSLSDRAFPGAL